MIKYTALKEYKKGQKELEEATKGNEEEEANHQRGRGEAREWGEAAKRKKGTRREKSREEGWWRLEFHFPAYSYLKFQSHPFALGSVIHRLSRSNEWQLSIVFSKAVGGDRLGTARADRGRGLDFFCGLKDNKYYNEGWKGQRKIGKRKPAVKEERVSKKQDKKKAAKDPNKPKRPASAFFVFMEEFRKTYKDNHPNVKSVAVIGKAGGEKWKSLSEADKAPYVAKAGKRKAEYEKNIATYNNKKSSAEDVAEESDKSKSEVNDEDDEESGEEEDDE
ncbi:hypothetical protein SUGI_0489910 [Cryptomeria japonica]|nr:hypothetical protein SUGI_0489910 [Cryptomeria japonica]